MEGKGLRIKAIKEYVTGYGQYARTDYILITTTNKCFKSQPPITTFIKASLNHKKKCNG